MLPWRQTFTKKHKPISQHVKFQLQTTKKITRYPRNKDGLPVTMGTCLWWASVSSNMSHQSSKRWEARARERVKSYEREYSVFIGREIWKPRTKWWHFSKKKKLKSMLSKRRRIQKFEKLLNYLPISIWFGNHWWGICNSDDCTAPVSDFPSHSNHRHWLRQLVAVAVRECRHRSVLSTSVQVCTPLF